MDSSINIKIDFTNVSAATGRISILPSGLHIGVIEEFAHFTDSGSVLYVYMNTDGMRHRERFNLDNEKALPFVKAFLLSAGVPDGKLAGKTEIPFNKFMGRTVYFNYIAPTVDEKGKAVQGSYAKYTFYSKDRYQAMAALNSEADSVETKVATNNGTATVKAEGGDDFEFLLS